ncbi:hypothetical protein [Porphyromonas gulae]|nr:hypothetical protein [Porphyromonas gulae]
MKKEDIQKAIWLQADLENVQQALKASSILCIIPDMCGISEVRLRDEAMCVVKKALLEYRKNIETEIESL